MLRRRERDSEDKIVVMVLGVEMAFKGLTSLTSGDTRDPVNASLRMYVNQALTHSLILTQRSQPLRQDQYYNLGRRGEYIPRPVTVCRNLLESCSLHLLIAYRMLQ
jgi:hypothetical protein